MLRESKFLNKQIKLCIITPTLSGGGAERVAVNLANYYASNGLDVSLLFFKGDGVYKDQVNSLVRVIDLNTPRIRSVYFKLIKALNKENPSHVISVKRDCNIIVGLASFFNSKRVIVFREASTMNGVFQLSLIKRFILINLMRFSYLRANCVIANSKDTKYDLVRFKIKKYEKIVVLGNPVLPENLEKLINSSCPHAWLSDNSLRVILTVGRLNKLKNQRLLISAFSELYKIYPDLRLIILGEGNEKESLNNLSVKLNVDNVVDIVSFCSNPYPFYKNSELFVLTSNWEGFGNVLVEALACETPVVSTDCPGGPRNILKNGEFGSLVPCNDLNSLIKVIKKILDGEIVYDKSKLAVRSADFTIGSIADEYLEVIINKV